MASVAGKSRSKGQEKGVKSKKPRTKPAEQEFKSSEYVQDSDDDEVEEVAEKAKSDSSSSDCEEDLPERPKVVKPKVNGKAASEVTTSIGSKSESESESSSSSSGEEEDESDESSEKNEEESSGEKEDSEDEEDEQEEERPKQVRAPSPTRTSDAPDPNSQNQQDSESTPPKHPFSPPQGFDLTTIEDTPTASQLFKKSLLQGKQIWHITAPSSIPISSISNLSLEDAKLGKLAFTHEGNDYAFFEDTVQDKSYLKVVIPMGSGEGYRTSSKAVDHVIHVQQMSKLSRVTHLNAGSQATTPAKKPVRQQPQGLKMRFHPIGFDENEMSRQTDLSSVKKSQVEGGSNKAHKSNDMKGSPDVADAEMTGALKKKKKLKRKNEDSQEVDRSLKRKKHGDSKKEKKEKKAKKISLG